MKNNYNNEQMNKALLSSKVNVELEGLTVSNYNNEICKKLLKGEISNNEATQLILSYYGIKN